MFLNRWSILYGIPGNQLSENGVHFVSKFFYVYCTLVVVKKVTTTAYYPQSDTQAGSLNSSLTTGLRLCVAKKQKGFDNFVQLLTCTFNTKTYGSMQDTSLSLMVTTYVVPCDFLQPNFCFRLTRQMCLRKPYIGSIWQRFTQCEVQQIAASSMSSNSTRRTSAPQYNGSWDSV